MLLPVDGYSVGEHPIIARLLKGMFHTRGGTPLFGLYGDVPLDRVWFFGLAVLNRVCNLICLCPKQVRTCPKQGMVLLFFFLACHPGPERS